MSGPGSVAGHAFISYAREDSGYVDRLERALEAAGIPVWRDTRDLRPGQDWKLNISRAIRVDALVFIACFSRASLTKASSFQNEELLLAIEQLRLRPPDYPWLIPVRFDDCDIPDRDLGGGRTLASIQRADIFGEASQVGMARLVAAIWRILGRDLGSDAIPADPARKRRVGVEVRIADPDSQDAGLRTPVRSVVYVTADEPIDDLDACYVTDQYSGGTTGLGYSPFHVSTSTWRIRSEFLLRSVADVIIGYTVLTDGRKAQWFQWNGHNHRYDWNVPGADGSHLSALLQIRKATLTGYGADQRA